MYMNNTRLVTLKIISSHTDVGTGLDIHIVCLLKSTCTDADT